MQSVRILTGIAQLLIAAAALVIAMGYGPEDTQLLAALIAIQNALTGVRRVLHGEETTARDD